jgi:nucleoside-diphosphate-sugar epimerase
MKVLVTGASGQLGGHVAELLADRGDTVRALVRPTSKRAHLVKLPNLEFFEAGLDEPERLDAAVAGVDAVVHAAGLVKARDPDEFFTVNVGGTSNLIEAARLRGPELRRFVYVSSLEACGPSADGEPVPITQENPVTAYGRSKLAAEKVVLAAKDVLPVVVLRPGAIYGPRDVEIFAAFQSIHRGLLPLVGGGHAKSVWIYGSDCAQACVRAILAEVPSGRVYFVDDGCGPLTQRQMLLDAERALGGRAFLHANLPVPAFMGVARALEIAGRVTGRPVMLTREKANMLLKDWVCSSEDTRRELDWTPAVSWKEGVERTVRWYRDNKWL